MNYKDASIVDDFMYGSSVAQSHVNVRLGFLRKVYGILSIQLVATTIISGVIMMIPGYKEFIIENNSLMLLSFIATIGITIALMVKRKDYPANYFLLAAFTFLESFTVGTITSFYDKTIVIEAFFLTATLVICLTVYTLQSKRDFSSWGAVLFTFLWLLIISGIMQMFVQSDALNFVLSLGGALLFSLFIIYDTHVIMKTLSPEEYIVGVINLYLDILNLFIKILQILDEIRSK